MPIRNPFSKRPGVITAIDTLNDENAHPAARNGPDKGFEDAQVTGQKPLSLKGIKEPPNEYKMSVVNDSGVYLPPSPNEEKKTFWSTRSASTTSSNHRSIVNENEPFSISRESFDSYRRSFDISARSPILLPDSTPPRRSFDARRLPRPVLQERRMDSAPPPTTEEVFEEVGLNDETKPKRKSIFSRFGDSTEPSSPSSTQPGSSGSMHLGFHFTGRKRGHSGQGAELGKIDRPLSSAGTKA